MLQNLICYECKCSPDSCSSSILLRCKNCIKKTCCCPSIHKSKFSLNTNLISLLFKNVRKMFAAALGIEILCIMSAEIGQNGGLYILGFNLVGITLSYMIGFLLAGFSTFMSILGRHDFSNVYNAKIEGRGCCSFLEVNSSKGFIFNLVETFLNFERGFFKFVHNTNNPQMKDIVKQSIIILITAESACILTAETVDLLFYKSLSILAIPLSLIVGTLTLTIVESLKTIKNMNALKEVNCKCEKSNDKITTPSSFFIPSFKFQNTKVNGQK
jgi:hypothetical protein